MKTRTKRIIKKVLSFIIVISIIFGGYIYYKNGNLKAGLELLKSKGFLINDYSNLKGSKLTGEEYSFDITYNPYYGMLNSSERKVYKQVYANMIHRKKTFIPNEKMNVNNVNKIIEAVMNDNPELFWVDNNYKYKYTPDKICRQVILSYNGLARNYKYNKSVFDSKVNSIVNVANTLPTVYERELYVHDQLIKTITYSKTSMYNQTAYSALVNGRTVCAGYAKAFQYIMSRLGIPTYYVTGVSAGEDHAWNIIKLSDGYYNVDVTWDDTSGSRYNYFNRTDNDFRSSHSRNSLSRYLPNCNSTTYSYSNMNNNNKKKPITSNTPVPKPTTTPKEEEKDEVEEFNEEVETEDIEE